MKVKLVKDTLVSAISKIRGSVSNDSINPVLEHFYFEIQNKKLTVKATNVQSSLIWSTGVESEDSFSFTVPGKLFAGLVSSLEGHYAEFDYDPTTKDVLLTCGKFTWECASGKVEDFPALKIPENLKEVQLPENFLNLLNSVYFSISNDTLKHDLNSLCLDLNNKSMMLTATDKIRLSYAKGSFQENSEEKRLVIPRNSVSELIKLIPTSLLYAKDNNRIYFKKIESTGEYTFITSLVNIEYPNVVSYINNEFKEKELKVKKQDFLRVIKRQKIISDKKIATFIIKENKMMITSLNTSSKSKEEIDVTYEGEATFKANLDYVLDYLTQEVSDYISFKIIGNKCLVFDKIDYRHVLSINNM